jgi:ABC-type polysaccharide transport system permease subunit
MLILNAAQTLLPLSAVIIFASLISYVLTWFIVKKNSKLIFLMPIILIMITIGFTIAGFLSQDWGRLGYIIMAFISLGIFFGSLISSFIIKSKLKKNLS